MTDAAHQARRSRKLMGVVLAAVVALVVPLSVVPTALGAPPPTATQIHFNVQTAGEPLPIGAPGAIGNLYVVKDKSFTVQLSFTDAAGNPAPLANGGRTVVDVTYGTTLITTFTVPGGEVATEVKASTYRFTDLAKDVQFLATASTKPTALLDQSPSFDVLVTSGVASQTDLTSISRESGVGASPCTATGAVPVCADLVPGLAATQPGLLSIADCRSADACKGTDVVQALLPLRPPTEILSSPATLVMKCDKTLCGVGPLQQQTLEVVIRPGSTPVTAPACPSKGTVAPYNDNAPYTTDNAPFCVDYVQSTRDNAGDTVLYLLFVEDAKVRFS